MYSKARVTLFLHVIAVSWEFLSRHRVHTLGAPWRLGI